MDAYIPVYTQGDNTWYPSNEAAITLVRLLHVWKDIAKLNEIRLSVRNSDVIADKLLLKHILVEFFSALDHAKVLQRIIRKSPRLVFGSPAPSRYITRVDLERSTVAFKNFWRELSPKEQIIAKIRNNIGAHRSAEIGVELNELWHELDAENFISLLNGIPAIIDAVKDINIYNWSWMDSETSTGSIIGCRIVHVWEDAFEPEQDGNDKV